MIEILVALATLVVSLFFWPILNFLKLRTKRNIIGKWTVAYQAPYYLNQGWKYQEIQIQPSIFGYRLKTDQDITQLHWAAFLRLETHSLLTGKWKSLRDGSKSEGVLTLQISSNGKLGWGRIFGTLSDNRKAKIGAFVMAREQTELPIAWSAMKTTYPKLLLPLISP